MAVKPTAKLTPTAKIIQSHTATATDEDGRVITVRKLDAADKMDLLQVVGATNSSNAPLIQMAFVAFSVTQIDNLPIGTPANYNVLRGTIKRLDDKGMRAATEAIASLYPTESEDDLMDNAKN